MKFVLAYTSQAGGSAEDNIKSAEAAQKLLANWTPSPSGEIQQWTQRVDGNGGFAVVVTDDATSLFRDLATWTPWLKFEVHPVLDILDATAAQEEALQKAASVI